MNNVNHIGLALQFECPDCQPALMCPPIARDDKMCALTHKKHRSEKSLLVYLSDKINVNCATIWKKMTKAVTRTLFGLVQLLNSIFIFLFIRVRNKKNGIELKTKDPCYNIDDQSPP